MKYAVIGGTGVYEFMKKKEQRTVKTKYGEVEVDIVNYKDIEVAFLARHGKGHSQPPHKVNYRANLMALSELGVKYIYATAAVGSLNKKFAPGDIVIVDDLIDQTKCRQLTFYEAEEDEVVHVDMSDPYCSNLRREFYDKANKMELGIKGSGVYVATEGPRLETKAEIKMYKDFGGDLVGMTAVPEVVLAKELKMCYSAAAIITNWAAGFGDGVSTHDIHQSLAKNKDSIVKVFMEIFLDGLDQENCSCSDSLLKV